MTNLNEKIDFSGLKPQSSFSGISAHRRCPQAWAYRNVFRVERLQEEPSPYLTLGSWWAALRGVEAIERGTRGKSLEFAPKALTAEYYSFTGGSTVTDVLEAAEARWGRMGAEPREEFAGIFGDTLPGRLNNMFEMWESTDREKRAKERPVGVEVFWKRRLPKPSAVGSWTAVDLDRYPTMRLIGYVDEIYYDDERNMLVIRDDKTAKDLASANSAVDDLMDSQLFLYVWGLRPKLARAGLPAPRAIGFDRIRSVAAKEPQLTATGKLSRAVTAYDAETYRRWATEDTRPTPGDLEALGMTPAQLEATLEVLAEPGRVWGKIGEFVAGGPRRGEPKFGVYTLEDEVLEGLETSPERSRWVAKTLVPVNYRIVEAHVQAASDTAFDIWQTQRRIEQIGEAARNLDRRGCQFCEFSKLCRAQLMGGPDGDYDLEAFGLAKRPERKEKRG